MCQNPTLAFIRFLKGFPGDSNVKESTCGAGDLGSIPGLGRSPGEGKGLPIPVFWAGEFHGLYHPWGCKELDMTEQLSLITAGDVGSIPGPGIPHALE